MSQKTILLLLKAGVSIGLIALLIWRADLRATLTILGDVKLWAFAAALVSMAFGVLLRACKWHLLLRVQGGSGSFLTSVRVTYMSMFVNNFFLGTLGGDAFRAHHASNYSNSVGAAASAVIAERATGIFSAILLVYFAGILLAPRELVTTRLLLIVSIVAAIGVVSLGVLVSLRSKLRRIPILRRFPKLTGFSHDLTTSLQIYRNHLGVLAAALILSLAFYLVQTMTVSLLAVAARTELGFLSLLFIIPLTGILAVIPISINGIGVKEGATIFYLEQIGTPGSAAFLIAISARVGNLLISLVGGLFLLVQSLGRRKATLTAE
jgi:uncharacterized protein (TIRG00374 family)